jgi:hypothetical protein
MNAENDTKSNEGGGRSTSSVKKLLLAAEIVIAAAAICIIAAAALGLHPPRPTEADKPSGVMELSTDAGSEYLSLRDALDKNDAFDAQCPTWIPEDFKIQSVAAETSDSISRFSATYAGDNRDFTIRILSMGGSVSRISEVLPGSCETVTINGQDYVFASNADYRKAIWSTGKYSYTILGHVTDDELTDMIKSITD